jgi:hypothetical protein
MKRNKNDRRLELSRECLRSLTASSLEVVQGGGVLGGASVVHNGQPDCQVVPPNVRLPQRIM